MDCEITRTKAVRARRKKEGGKPENKTGIKKLLG